ncbi:MAG: Corrinoid adenosyltransferase [Hyphomicrobiaceae bacterium hypho_1]
MIDKDSLDFTILDETENSYSKKMSLKKPLRDHVMSRKTIQKGLLIVCTGEGKGKSTSAFGMIFRAIAHNIPSAVVQFIKGGMETGERNLITKHFSHLCQFHTMGEGFTWETQDPQRDITYANEAWEKAQMLICDPKIKIVLLDELSIAVRYNYIDVDGILSFLKNKKPYDTHVIITGRNAHKSVIDMADLATEMKLLKHPFRSGIKAQAGIDF